jgi:hypothetical protein
MGQSGDFDHPSFSPDGSCFVALNERNRDRDIIDAHFGKVIGSLSPQSTDYWFDRNHTFSYDGHMILGFVPIRGNWKLQVWEPQKLG